MRPAPVSRFRPRDAPSSGLSAVQGNEVVTRFPPGALEGVGVGSGRASLAPWRASSPGRTSAVGGNSRNLFRVSSFRIKVFLSRLPRGRGGGRGPDGGGGPPHPRDPRRRRTPSSAARLSGPLGATPPHFRAEIRPKDDSKLPRQKTQPGGGDEARRPRGERDGRVAGRGRGRRRRGLRPRRRRRRGAPAALGAALAAGGRGRGEGAPAAVALHAGARRGRRPALPRGDGPRRQLRGGPRREPPRPPVRSANPTPPATRARAPPPHPPAPPARARAGGNKTTLLEVL